MTGVNSETMCARIVSRRQMLAGAVAVAMPFLGSLPLAYAATGRDLRFLASWNGSPVGDHHVRFRMEGDRLTVRTRIEIDVTVLFFSAFRLRHHAQEVWRAGRLESVTSTTDLDGTRLQVAGEAVEQGFRVVGKDGPFLADGQLLTSNSLWDSRIVSETRLIDVQHGSVVGLVARPLGEVQVDMPQGSMRASRYQMITPHYAGSVFYDGDSRWIKASIEYKGETIEYALAT